MFHVIYSTWTKHCPQPQNSEGDRNVKSGSSFLPPLPSLSLYYIYIEGSIVEYHTFLSITHLCHASPATSIPTMLRHSASSVAMNRKVSMNSYHKNIKNSRPVHGRELNKYRNQTFGLSFISFNSETCTMLPNIPTFPYTTSLSSGKSSIAERAAYTMHAGFPTQFIHDSFISLSHQSST